MAQLPAMKDAQMKDGIAQGGANELGVSGTALGYHSSAPAWIELLPAGDFAGRDGRGPFRLSNPEKVIAATDGLRMEAGLPIDYDHATDFAAPVGRPAPAAGWIRAMEVRNGALWGNIEWTDHGAAAVLTHEYRYISPVFEYSHNGEVQRLLRAALTNNPNLYMTAISAAGTRKNVTAITESLRSEVSAHPDRTAQQNLGSEDVETQLRVLFGLDKEATAEAIVAEVHSLLLGENRASGQVGTTLPEKTFATTGGGSSDPARYVPVAQFESALTELNRLRAARARERAELRVDAAMRGGRIVPAQREWAIAYCQANQHGFDYFVARQPVVLSNLGGSFEGEPSETRRWVDDRETVNVEKGRTNSTLSRTELAVCAQLGLRPQEYLRRRGARDDIQMGNSN